jgi:hypothetical protein
MKTINFSLFFCPKCGSKNVGKVFTVPVNMVNMKKPFPLLKLHIGEKDRCLDCKYEALKGHFEKINNRNKKIETILE